MSASTTTAIILVSWVVFWTYWIASARGVKASVGFGRYKYRTARTGFLIAALVLIRLTSGSENYHITPHNSLVRAVGLGVFFAGLILAIWARRNLGTNWGMPMSQKKDPELVTSGPYRSIRHPIYSGILLAVVGCMLALNLYWGILLILQGFYFVYSAREEEKLLSRQFPKTYPSYKKKTKMLIPYIL